MAALNDLRDNMTVKEQAQRKADEDEKFQEVQQFLNQGKLFLDLLAIDRQS